MSRDTDFLRKLGMPDDKITALQAELDQKTAEADHLIGHAVRLHRGSVEVAAIEGLAIRGHIDAIEPDQLRKVFGVVVSQAGQLACALESLSAENARLTDALAGAQEGQL